MSKLESKQDVLNKSTIEKTRVSKYHTQNSISNKSQTKQQNNRYIFSKVSKDHSRFRTSSRIDEQSVAEKIEKIIIIGQN